MGQNPTDSEVNDMINEVDVDGSGVVEFEEFVNFFSRLMKNLNPQNEVREAFRRFVERLSIEKRILQAYMNNVYVRDKYIDAKIVPNYYHVITSESRLDSMCCKTVLLA